MFLASSLLLVGTGLFLAAAGLVPSRYIEPVYIGDEVVDLRDIAVVAYFLLVLALAVQRRLCGGPGLVRPVWRLVAINIGILAYASISLLWVNIEPHDRAGMGMSLIIFGASALIGACVVGVLPERHLASAIRFAALAVSGLALLYLLESLGVIGIRGAAYKLISLSFNIERVSGPLFGPSNGYFLLLPVLGILVDEIASDPRRALYIPAAVSVCVTLICLGSRGAVMCAILMFLLYSRKRYSGRKGSKAVGAMVIVLSLGASTYWLSARISADRLRDFEDQERSRIYDRSIEVISARTVSENIFGSGYGAVWPFYSVYRAISRDNLTFQTASEFGNVGLTGDLLHPHSVLLGMAVELGVPGLVFLVLFLRTVYGIYADGEGWPCFRAGILASTGALFLEYILFYTQNTRMVSIWGFFVFALLQMQTPRCASPRRGAIERVLLVEKPMAKSLA